MRRGPSYVAHLERSKQNRHTPDTTTGRSDTANTLLKPRPFCPMSSPVGSIRADQMRSMWIPIPNLLAGGVLTESMETWLPPAHNLVYSPPHSPTCVHACGHVKSWTSHAAAVSCKPCGRHHTLGQLNPHPHLRQPPPYFTLLDSLTDSSHGLHPTYMVACLIHQRSRTLANHTYTVLTKRHTFAQIPHLAACLIHQRCTARAPRKAGSRVHCWLGEGTHLPPPPQGREPMRAEIVNWECVLVQQKRVPSPSSIQDLALHPLKNKHTRAYMHARAHTHTYIYRTQLDIGHCGMVHICRQT